MPSFYQWDALYSSDLDRLQEAFGGSAVRQQLDRPYARGISKLAARFGWGRPAPEGQTDDRLHVPLAADLCAATAELGWSDPPQITASLPAAQDRIAEYVDARALAVFAAGTEIGAALGGHYLQAVLPDDGGHCLFEVLAYDGAWPRFSRGKLIDVAFWWELARDDRAIWRHFESHELDGAGNGLIRHALFRGTNDKIGERMPLGARPETAGLTDNGNGLVGSEEERVFDTGPGLDVVHIPSRTPQRVWRKHPVGRFLGRSILQGVEGPLSRLDDAYTSWMRDIELGRSRLLIASSLLEQPGQGQAGMFDVDRRLITPVEMPPAFGGGAQLDPIRMVQFQIRVDQHRQTCQELTEIVLRAASYSAQTFGEDENGNAMTATGVMSKDSRSMRTRRAFLADETAGVQYIIRKALQMDGLPDDTVEVVFPDGAQDSPITVAQTAAALRAAEAASDETIVRIVQPDWTPEQVALEVQAIQAQRGAQLPPLADPLAVGGNDVVTDAG
jgi:hypothetical protein